MGLIILLIMVTIAWFVLYSSDIQKRADEIYEENDRRNAMMKKNAQVDHASKHTSSSAAINMKPEACPQAEQCAQADKQRKAAEKSAQKAPTETAENTPEGLSVLRSLPAAWVVLGTGLPKKWPAVDIQGFFHVFTDEGAATAFAQPNGFAVEKMTGTALCDRLKEWQRYGITHIRLHQGNETREFLEKELGFGNNFNSDLQEVMIRYLQTKALNIDGAAETAKIFWKLLCKMIQERLFLVPFCFEGEDINAPVEDNTLRLFPSAAKLITKQRAEGKILLFDGYPFADKADGRPMHFRTLRSVTTGKEVLPVHTDFHEMLPIWQGRAHFALATFDDFKDNYQPAGGVIINPISQALMLEPKDIEEIKKMQASSAAEKTAQKAEEPKPSPAPAPVDAEIQASYQWEELSPEKHRLEGVIPGKTIYKCKYKRSGSQTEYQYSIHNLAMDLPAFERFAQMFEKEASLHHQEVRNESYQYLDSDEYNLDELTDKDMRSAGIMADICFGLHICYETKFVADYPDGNLSFWGGFIGWSEEEDKHEGRLYLELRNPTLKLEAAFIRALVQYEKEKSTNNVPFVNTKFREK